jgi:Protein of unknown function (DUF2846)/Short C-terminal domain
MTGICRAILIAVILLLYGCVSVPMAAIEEDAKAKDFSLTPGKASLYIYRNELFGGAVPMTVIINGRTLGQSAPQTYYRLSLIPGQYTVESHAENVSKLALSLQAGKNYFVWQEVKMGFFFARSLLQEVDEKTGRAGVMESKLAASAIADSEIRPLDKPMAADTPVPASDSVNQKLRELQTLRKDGLISDEEYEKKRQELLQKL